MEECDRKRKIETKKDNIPNKTPKEYEKVLNSQTQHPIRRISHYYSSLTFVLLSVILNNVLYFKVNDGVRDMFFLPFSKTITLLSMMMLVNFN